MAPTLQSYIAQSVMLMVILTLVLVVHHEMQLYHEQKEFNTMSQTAKLMSKVGQIVGDTRNEPSSMQDHSIIEKFSSFTKTATDATKAMWTNATLTARPTAKPIEKRPQKVTGSVRGEIMFLPD